MARSTFGFAVIASLLLSLAGCATAPTNPIIPPAVSPATPVHKIDKNYQLGQQLSAYVGAPMLRVKDYWVTHRDSGVYQLPQAITYHQLFMRPKTFPAGTPLAFLGYYMLDGQRLKVLALPDRDASMFPMLVDDSGRFTNKLLNRVNGGWFEQTGGKVASIEDFTPPLQFAPHTVDDVSAESGYTNFELLYAGSNANEVNLIYREYTPTDLARAAFTQNLTYDRHAPTIRFRDIKIKVLGADNESIRYVVQQDGMEGQQAHQQSAVDGSRNQR